MINKIDGVILGAYQKLQDQSQDWLGRDCFALSRFCIYIYALSTLVEITIHVMQGEYVHCVVGSLSCLFVSWIFFRNIALLEGSCKSAPNFLNEIAASMARIRIILLSVECYFIITAFVRIAFKNHLVAEQIHDLADASTCICYISAVYFMSCTPNPMKPSKLKQLLLKGKELVRNLLPAPEPSFA